MMKLYPAGKVQERYEQQDKYAVDILQHCNDTGMSAFEIALFLLRITNPLKGLTLTIDEPAKDHSDKSWEIASELKHLREAVVGATKVWGYKETKEPVHLPQFHIHPTEDQGEKE